MARTIARATTMTERIVIRATAKDKAEVAIAGQKLGMDSSAFIRYLLIKEKVITPLG